MHQSLSAQRNDLGVQVEIWRVLEAQLTMGELARIVPMNPPTLTKMADRMVMNGLIRRQNGRQVNLMLTDLGRKRMTQIRSAVQEQDEKMREVLGDERAMRFQAFLTDQT